MTSRAEPQHRVLAPMRLLFPKARLSTAVLICNWHYEGLNPLSRDLPIWMFPVLNIPLIEHAVRALKMNGFSRVILTAPAMTFNAQAYLDRLCTNVPLDVLPFEEERPQGSAGVLRDIRGLLGDEPFLAVQGNAFFHEFDIHEMLLEHHASASVITAGVRRDERPSEEVVCVGEGGLIKGFHNIHPSRERRSPFRFSGIYIISPTALGFINSKGYFDIKEQLIPAISNSGLPVRIHELSGYTRTIDTIEDYYEVNRDILQSKTFHKEGLVEVGEGVWAGKGAIISPKAYIAGPVILGERTTISDNAQIIGPSVIGEDSFIGERAKVRESVLWRDSNIGEGATIKYSIASEGLKISSSQTISQKVIVDSLTPGDRSIMPSKYELKGVMESFALQMNGFRYTAFLLTKRMIDIAASIILLALLSPVFLGIAVVIRRDSPGPVLYRQNRCGKDGREFPMLKFRTMVKDAHSMQKELAKENKVDGPMFKLENDPRITTVGRFLRKTSLDELPQLVNVLKGQMSLVGPRPLVMDEMSFSPSWRAIRLKVKPGITGLWQVEGRSDAPFHDWIKYDVFYVKAQSIFLDLKILIKTALVVFKKGGAY